MSASSITSLSPISPTTSSASSMMPSIAGAVDALHFRTVHPKDLLEAGDVILRLVQVSLEATLQSRITRLLDHVGQRFGDLVLGVIGVIGVAQCVHEQVVQRLD